MTPLESAKLWLERGFLPVPVPHRHKAPIVDRWQKLRLNLNDLPTYFSAAPQNIGILLGDESGSADIDCDCMEAVAAAAELAPPTAMTFGRKSKPASHYIYRSIPRVPSRKFIDPTDKSTIVELRCQTADGGIGLQTVVPPSIHPSGEHIRFEPGRDGSPSRVEASTLAAVVAPIAAAALLARHWPKEGCRHDAFLALAGILARADWTVKDAVTFHRAIYRALFGASADLFACETEVKSTFDKQALGGEITGFQSLSELMHKAALETALAWLNISRKLPAAVEVIEWPEFAPFSSRDVTSLTPEMFPGFLGEMVNAVSKATETPVELAGMLGLAVVAACIAGKVTVSPEPGYVEPLNIYAAVGMESGNRKTAVLRHMARPFIDWEHAETERLLPERKRLISERKTQEAKIDSLRKRAAKSATDAGLLAQIAELEVALPEVPALRRLWVQDVTPEQLAVIMADQGERIALLSDEGGIFDLLAGRYSKGIPNLDVFLQAHAGSSVRIDRGSRPPVLMRHPALTVALAPQPDVLQSLADQPGFRGRGLLARFLYALPASPLGSRRLIAEPVPIQIEDEYRAGILRLLSVAPPSLSDSIGRLGAWRLQLSPQAYASWKEFQMSIELLMTEGGKLHYLKDWASKLPGAAARIAGIMHCVCASPEENSIIGVAIMEQALGLSTALIGHALMVFDLMQLDPVIEDAKQILRWIRRHGKPQFTIRDCFCAHQGRFKKVDAIFPPIYLLEQHGYVRTAPITKTVGRRSEIYLVNPKFLELMP